MSIIIGFISGPTSSGMMTWYAATLDCGHRWYELPTTYAPITSKVIGDEVACKTCAEELHDQEWLESLDYSIVHHSRAKQWCGVYQYHFYRLDHSSPSNFMLIGSVKATSKIDEILRRKTNCGPLSPTEPA